MGWKTKAFGGSHATALEADSKTVDLRFLYYFHNFAHKSFLFIKLMWNYSGTLKTVIQEMILKIFPGATKMAQITSTGCSSRVPGFNSQHSNKPWLTTCNSSTRGSNTLF